MSALLEAYHWMAAGGLSLDGCWRPIIGWLLEAYHWMAPAEGDEQGGGSGSSSRRKRRKKTY
jgi:hypothetical protein